MSSIPATNPSFGETCSTCCGSMATLFQQTAASAAKAGRAAFNTISAAACATAAKVQSVAGPILSQIKDFVQTQPAAAFGFGLTAALGGALILWLANKAFNNNPNSSATTTTTATVPNQTTQSPKATTGSITAATNSTS